MRSRRTGLTLVGQQPTYHCCVLTPSYVNFSVSENDRLRYHTEVEKGLLREPEDQKFIAEIVLADGSIFPHHGEVTFLNPMFNPQTGTFLIRVTVDNPDGWLRRTSLCAST